MLPHVQHKFPFARPLAARVRSVRRAFHPSPAAGAYRLPHDIRDRLTAALAPFRNRDAAFVLATFIARFWSVPGRVAGSFPIDRRALADHEALELTEARVRGAIRTLEAVGFIDRALAPSGSRYRATEHGLRRKVILYVFGADYAPAFLEANRRAHRSRKGGDPHARRMVTPSGTSRASVSVPDGPRANSPKSKSEADPQVIMGELRKGSGLPPEPSASSPLEAALERLGRAIDGAGNG